MRLKFEISGLIQGVGFRPFVVKIANELSLDGFVFNDLNGVAIEIEGKNAIEFEKKLLDKAPKMARIDKISSCQIAPKNEIGFKILQSVSSGASTLSLPPDFSLCGACEKEMNDAKNRRFAYPFIACTDCGPRYSMILKMPFDRQNSAMNEFEMCEECESEYKNLENRRFHAQAICCQKCGPKLDGDIKELAKRIKGGEVCAIKGVGGYNLICDALNEGAIDSLRNVKKRPFKPLAVMFGDLDSLKNYASPNEAEIKALNSIERPIVLIQKNAGLAHNISFESKLIGAFLPYSPLHKLIINMAQTPLVITSANLSSEPIITTKEDIAKRFNGIFTISHNRKIISACDDSVVRVANDKPYFLRTARGFAPRSIRLSKTFAEPILCVGSHQKNTVALGIKDFIVVSPYIADLDNLASVDRFEETIERLKIIYGVSPKIIVCDAHPKYASTIYANSQSVQVLPLQHHKAHLYAALFDENLMERDAFGVIWDGAGYGDDGSIWGGEFFTKINGALDRISSLEPFYLLGGERAAKEPRLCALSLLFAEFGQDALRLDLPTIKAFNADELKTLWNAYNKKIGVVKTSSVGRLFDAVASILGFLQISNYEGQSGLILEFKYASAKAYDVKTPKEIIAKLAFEKDKSQGVGRFFSTLIKILFDSVEPYNLPIVASGGVFLNATLRELALNEAKKRGAEFYAHARPSDESISFGQAVYALMRFDLKSK